VGRGLLGRGGGVLQDTHDHHLGMSGTEPAEEVFGVMRGMIKVNHQARKSLGRKGQGQLVRAGKVNGGQRWKLRPGREGFLQGATKTIRKRTLI